MRTEREVAAPVDRWTAWPVYWGPVILGAMAAVVATVLFGLIGTAIGAHKAGSEARITTWSGVGFAGLAYAVIASFFAFVIGAWAARSEEHTSELQSLAYLVCRLLLEKKNKE